MLRALTASVILGSLAAAAETRHTWPPWDGKEQVEEYARRNGLKATETLDLGDGVTLDFVLVPPGRFMMGTPMPERPTESVLVGQALLAVGGVCLAALVLPLLYRALRHRQRFQFSLRRCVLMTLAAGLCVGGIVRWVMAEQAQRRYEAGLVRLQNSHCQEAPAHWVTITRPFYLGKYEVTQDQYAQAMHSDPSLFKGPKLPVETVTWDEAQAFCVRSTLSSKWDVRLPTEAEWEYACRGGPVTKDAGDSLGAAAWYKDNSGGRTHPVGELAPNALGLFDMQGNVWEWCQDLQCKYQAGDATDPVQNTPEPGLEWRALRGGSWYVDANAARPAKRAGCVHEMKLEYIGFRVAMDLLPSR